MNGILKDDGSATLQDLLNHTTTGPFLIEDSDAVHFID